MSDEMDDDDDGNGAGTEQVVSAVDAFLKVMGSDTVRVTLANGGAVSGSIAGLVLRKKTKKGEVTWKATLSIMTEAGNLQIDCHNVAAIA